jgi:hypothetical protein
VNCRGKSNVSPSVPVVILLRGAALFPSLVKVGCGLIAGKLL